MKSFCLGLSKFFIRRMRFLGRMSWKKPGSAVAAETACFDVVKVAFRTFHGIGLFVIQI